MPGSTFVAGEQKVRPGVYVRTVNSGGPQAVSLPQGIVAALFTASWGPLGQVVELEMIEGVADTYGSGGTVAGAEEAFRGGCKEVVAYRLGAGGVKATLNLKDTTAVTPVDVIRVDAKHPGTRGNSLRLTIRDSLTDTTKRELLVHEGTTWRQTFTFAKGGAGEVDALVAAVGAGSEWITATKLAAGNGLMAVISQTPLATGSDPTVVGADYSTALTAIETRAWNVLAIDSESATIHATAQAYIDRVRSEGKRVLVVLGEPTSVPFATRTTNSAAFNNLAIIYVANGFIGSDGSSREGYRAAARVAGMVAAAQITDSLTHVVVANTTDVVGHLTNADIETAINKGTLVFTKNAQGQVQIEYGINTLVTLSANQDAGWKKIRRVKTRDYLMNTIADTWDLIVGKVNNSPDGRATLIAAAQGVINNMIRDGALLSGTITEDKTRPPAGDSAWFTVTVDDLDSAEKLYLTFGFRFSAA